MDIMSVHGFGLDLKKRILRVGTQEFILYQKKEECAQMVLAKELTVSKRSELLVTAQVEGNI